MPRRANTGGSGEAGLRNGAGASTVAAQTEARNPIGTDRFEIGWFAKEIPAIGGFACCAEVIPLIIDIPRLAALKRDDGVDLPAFQELAPGFLFGKRE